MYKLEDCVVCGVAENFVEWFVEIRREGYDSTEYASVVSRAVDGMI